MREGFTRRIERNDGVVLDCAAQPLLDGAALLTFVDVSADVNVERALTDRNKALLAAEKLRNDFIHHVSYELRSPLNNINGFVHLLGEASTGPLNPRQREYLGYVSKSSAALLAIVDDILDLATIDEDAMALEFSEVDVEATMRAAIEGVQDRLVENSIDVQIVPMDDVGTFRGDAKRVRQILFNLLSNAIGFSRPGQTVTLAVMRRENEIVFKVTDRGRGMSPEILERVFDRFESHTAGSRHRGVGLGLSIVRAFMELHGGRVLIDSAPGEGTTVTCIFPAHAAHEDAHLAGGARRRRRMSDESAPKAVWRLDVASETETIELAQEISTLVRSGDAVMLSGDLGAGKTTFARAMIRALVEDPKLEAPSPTFTLMQIYEGAGKRVVHADFYRLGNTAELAGLGWEEETDDAIVLVEWAEGAREALSPDRLEVRLSFVDGDNREARRLTISGYGRFVSRLASFKAIRELLRQSGWAGASRSFLQGDASTRAYERLEQPDGRRAILMISPARPDGPPIRYGKSYSAIARLAENVVPFVALSQALRGVGLSAPEVYAKDLDAGLLIIEDLGGEGVVDDSGPIVERYLEAAGALAFLHAQRLPDVIAIEGNGDYRIPPYDLDALLIEVELLVDWYLPRLKASISSGARAIFLNIWRQALVEVGERRADLDPERLSLSQSFVACAAKRPGADRHPRFPGLRPWPSRL